MEKQTDPAVTQVPEWETPAAPTNTKYAGFKKHLTTLTSTFDRRLPPNKTYTPAKLKRRTFLLSLLAICLAVLALILGLSIGLTRRNKYGAAASYPTLPGSAAHGDLTYYMPGLGACGITSGDQDDIVAISHAVFDQSSKGSDPNANPLCGRQILAQRFDSRVGKTVSLVLKVVDRCVGCQPDDLDVSPGAFNQLADPDLGRTDVSWAWM